MTSSLPLSTARAALWVALLVSTAGCPLTVALSEEVPGEDREAGDDATGAFATSGCDPGEIATQNGGVCATCTAQDGGDVRVCGDADLADCINQENAYGERCQRCATAEGEVLFDDCAVAPEDVGAARCEVTDGDPSQGTDANPSECTVCFDDRGAVVSSSCEPISDECHDVVDGNLVCRECTRDGQVVVYQCGGADLDPAFCEAYQNDVGRCVDCYGESGGLLSHQCQLFGDEALVSCVETIDPSGVSCTQCFDQVGNLIQSGCDTALPEARACQMLEYSNQTCVVCVDDVGEPVLTDCQSSTCADPTAPDCAPPPDCWFEWDANQALCRTCLVDANTQETETRCLTNTDLVCTGVPADQLPPDPNAPGDQPAPPPSDGSDCLVCSDSASGVEVYRNCSGSGAPAQPPVCVDEVDELGNVCTWCYDAYNGAPLYSSCDGGDTCYVTGDRAITSSSGEQLTNDNGAAIATCYRCGAEGQDATLTESDFAALCALPQQCVGPDGFVDPNVECPPLVHYIVAPRSCENGWDVYGAAADSEEELLAVLGWSLSTRALSLAGVAVLGGTLDTSLCNDVCGNCPRGDLLEIAFEDVDVGVVRETFAADLLGCQADSDCPAQALCLGGVCGY